MWQAAVDELWESVALVASSRVAEVHGQTIRFPIPLGSAFRLGGGEHPLFLTAMHVLAEKDLPFEPLEGEVAIDENGGDVRQFAGVETHREELGLVSKTGKIQRGDVAPVSAGVEVRETDEDRDLALLAASPSGAELEPVQFAGDDWVETGVPTAALGYPLQEGPELGHQGGGQMTIKRRFAGGWMSGMSSQEAPSGEEFPHYEVDIRAYPGVSGAPLFNTAGQVIGLMRRTKMHGTAAVYGYAVRNDEIFSTLDEWGIDPAH